MVLLDFHLHQQELEQQLELGVLDLIDKQELELLNLKVELLTLLPQ